MTAVLSAVLPPKSPRTQPASQLHRDREGGHATSQIGSQRLELTGARSTSARFGSDRFRRDARVQTLHDAVDDKLRDLGRHALTGAHPEPTAYS